MPDRTIMITGAGGMLGREIARAAGQRVASVHAYAGADELDIVDGKQVARVVDQTRPDVIINAAAYTDVDGAESEPDLSQRVNATGPANLARAAQRSGALLVHYSTDYVFDGTFDGAYPADHPTAPINAYGRSKLMGEQTIRDAGCPHLILRTSWLFAPHSRNFVRTILRLAGEREELNVVNDQRGRPTYCPDLATMTLDLVDEVDRRGEGEQFKRTLNATNAGSCTWYEFASAIVEQAGLSCRVDPCGSDAFPRPAARPANSVLDLSDLEAMIGPPRHWREALRECVNLLMRESSAASDPTPAGQAGSTSRHHSPHS